jgi:hypothetical protein
MTSKSFVSPLTVAARRRIVATAIVYGLSLAVRFTSAAGEQVEIPPQSLQRIYPALSIMTKDGAQRPYGPNATQPVFSRRSWSLRASSSCPLTN